MADAGRHDLDQHFAGLAALRGRARRFRAAAWRQRRRRRGSSSSGLSSAIECSAYGTGRPGVNHPALQPMPRRVALARHEGAARSPESARPRASPRSARSSRCPRAFRPKCSPRPKRPPRAVAGEHADWTDRPFVTLDPATSTDLDQAFAIESAGADLLLHYAIADVAWFVARRRSRSTPRPGSAAPPPICPTARPASIRRRWPKTRPACCPTGRARRWCSPCGSRPTARSRLDGADARDRSAAAPSWPMRPRPRRGPAAAASPSSPGRIAAAEAPARRGPGRSARTGSRARRRTAVRAALPAPLASETPQCRAVARRQPGGRRCAAGRADRPVPDHGAARCERASTAPAPHRCGLRARLARSDAARAVRAPARPARPARRRLHARRAPRRQRRGYEPLREGVTPWHAAMAATYAHATAPLRRLADRYVLRAVLAIADGQAVPADVTDAFARLPAAMAKAEAREGQIERAVIDLAEAALLAGSEGETVRRGGHRSRRTRRAHPAVRPAGRRPRSTPHRRASRRGDSRPSWSRRRSGAAPPAVRAGRLNRNPLRSTRRPL